MPKIELTPEQAQTVMDLLNQMVELYGHEAGVLGYYLAPVAQELLEARLDAIGKAQEIIAVLAEC
ncbi:MAG: hypothetical protein HFF32_03980 [Flavonifractor sp.]|nr:hypothetical protein [Flavonifractor sp.]